MNKYEKIDVAVIGGGPAGTSAAYKLAQKGLKVILIEKEKMPRYKPCGGAIALHVEKILDFSIEPVVERKISKMSVTLNNKKLFVSDFKRPFVFMVMRDKFDMFLAEKAKEKGAIVFDKCSIKSFEQEKDGYTLKTSHGNFFVSYLVGADGANSYIRKSVGAPSFSRLSIAIEREIKAPIDILDNWRETLVLDFAHLKSGYAWIFPKARNFSVGVGGPLTASKELIPYYRKIQFEYRDELVEEPYISQGHRLPIRVPNEKIVYGRTLLVGDAAGLIDPLAGEGIYYAIRSGQIAAEVIAKAQVDKSGDLVKYQNMVDQEIQPELQTAKALLKLLDFSPRMWIPILLRESNPFFNYFCRVFTGEKEYKDISKKFGPIVEYLFRRLAEE